MFGHAIVLAAAFLLPGLFVLIRTVGLGGDLVETLGDSLGPLGRTILLSTTVSVSAVVVGTGLAWLLVRTDLPGRRVLRVLVVLPLVLPSFVGAAAFLAAVAPGGPVHSVLGVIGVVPPRLSGLLPSWQILTLFTYPYVFLPVAARLLAIPPSLEESARLLGRTGRQAFFEVTLPQLRSAILSGGLLVFLYTVSEFGAVQLLRYDTLTRVIYSSRLSDRPTSFASASILILLAVIVVLVERNVRGSARVNERSERFTPASQPLGRWRAAAFGAVGVVILFGVAVPVSSLTVWAWRGIVGGRVNFSRLVMPAINTAFVGTLTAAVAVAVIVPLAILVVRYRLRSSSAISAVVIAGFAVPGLVIALSLVSFAVNTPGVGWIYQTLPLLIVAYVIHFGAQAMGAAEDAVRAVPDKLRESSQLLESSALVRARRVDAPLMRPSLLSGGGLVLLSTIKELPATLLLAPIGFRTLATEVWGSYEDGRFAQVGVGGLVLISLSAVLTWFLVLKRSEAVVAA